MRKSLTEAQETLALDRELDNLLKKPESELTAEETKAIEESLADFISTYGGPLNELTLPRQYAERELPRILADAESKVARLKSELAALEQAEQSRAQTQDLTSALPQPDQILRVIRYETMIDRQIHRALTELRRIRSTRRKRSAKT